MSANFNQNRTEIGDLVGKSKSICLPPDIRNVREKVPCILATLLDEFAFVTLAVILSLWEIITTSGMLRGSLSIEETTHKNQKTSKCSSLKFIAVFQFRTSSILI